MKRFWLELTALVGAAVACALVANGMAASSRRLPVVGHYPNALRVPAVETATPLPAGGGATATPAAAAAGVLPGALPAGAFPPHPERPWVSITSDQALALHQAKVPFLDARRSHEHAEGHIPGALSVAIWEADVEERIDRFLATGHPPEAPVVIYCSGGECEDSHMLAERLHGRGLNNALVYADGFPDWVAKGRPVAGGSGAP